MSRARELGGLRDRKDVNSGSRRSALSLDRFPRRVRPALALAFLAALVLTGLYSARADEADAPSTRVGEIAVGTFSFGEDPAVEVQPVAPTPAEPGSSVDLTAVAQGDSAPSVAWQSSADGGVVDPWGPVDLAADGVSVATTVVDTKIVAGAAQIGRTTSVLTLVAPDAGGARFYRAVFTNPRESITTEAARVAALAASTELSTIAVVPSEVMVGDAADITVTVVDEAGAPMPGRSVEVTTTAGAIFLAGGPSGGSTGRASDNGNGTYSARLRAPDLVGDAEVSFTVDTAVAAKTAMVTFLPSPPSMAGSEISASPTSIVADGKQTSTITVTLKDARGNLVPGRTVEVFPSSGTLVGDIVDRRDGTYTVELQAPTRPGSARVEFQADNWTGPSALSFATVEFTAPEPSLEEEHSTIAVDPAEIVADGKSTSTITVALNSADGTPVPHRTDVVVSTSAGAFAGEGEADLVDALGEGEVLAVEREDAPGTYVATLTSSTDVESATVGFRLDEVTDGVGEATARVGFTAGAPVASGSSIVADPVAIGVDGAESQVTVSLVDAFGNPVAGRDDVVVSTTLGGFAVQDSEETPASVPAVPGTVAGTYVATLVSGAQAGEAVVGFAVTSAGGDFSGLSARVGFTAGAPSLKAEHSTIAVDPDRIVVGGVETSRVAVSLNDAHGNPLSGRDDVVVSTSAGAFVDGGVGPEGALEDLQDGEVIAVETEDTPGTYVATLTSGLKPESATVGFRLDQVTDGVGEATATVAFVAGAPIIEDATITASPERIEADGLTTSTLTVKLADKSAHGVRGEDVVVSTNLGEIVEDGGVAVDKGDGTYVATLKSGTTVGTAEVSFTVSGAEAPAKASVELVPGAPSPVDSSIASQHESIKVGGETSEITVSLVDDLKRPVGGQDVVITTTAGTITEPAETGPGTYTAVLSSPTKTGEALLGFTVNGQNADSTTTVGFAPGAPSLTDSSISSDPVSLSANGVDTSTISLTVVDDYGNRLTGRAVEVTTTGGTLAPMGGKSTRDTSTIATEIGDGVYQATLTAPTEKGHATVGFSIDGSDDAFSTAKVTFTAGESSLIDSTIDASPRSITADGTSTSDLKVTVVDVHGNELDGAEVVMTSTSGTIGDVTDQGDGTYTAQLTAPTVVGTATIGFTVNGESAPATVTVEHTPGDVSLSRSSISAAPTSLVANGSAQSEITVMVVDEHGNAREGRTVAVTTTMGMISEATEQGGGRYTATLTAATEMGSAIVGFSVDGYEAEATTTVAYTAGEPSREASTIGADPTSLPADGRSTSIISAKVVDDYGNPVTGRDVEISTTAGRISGVTGGAQGVYTATLTASAEADVASVGFSVGGEKYEATVDVTFTEARVPVVVEGGDPVGDQEPGDGSEVLAVADPKGPTGSMPVTGAQTAGFLTAAFFLLIAGRVLVAVRRAGSRRGSGTGTAAH